MNDSCKNCEAVGAAKAKTGDNRTALSRPSGYNATGKAVESKTRSRHMASNVNYHYKAPSYGVGSDNVKGYGA